MEARPYTLIAELTYRCPLRCAYCSNPLAWAADGDELDTSEWTRLFAEAEALGVVQVHFTGGEPLLRGDLEELVGAARRLDLYTNLITSAVPLSRDRLARLRAAGLDHVQLSVQDLDPDEADRVAGHASLEQKLAAAAATKQAGLALTLNVVLHRRNLDRLEGFIALAEDLGADALELANVQYHGWALLNRAALLPTVEQIERAAVLAAAARARLAGRMELRFVKPDYFAKWPKACMDGWGRRYLHVTPSGVALPCHAALSIRGLEFENVRRRSLEEIWFRSTGFERFRGTAWMPEPCRGCERREIDFGGCRCQAFALTGDAAATDPACALSPHRSILVAALGDGSEARPLVLRHPIRR